MNAQKGSLGIKMKKTVILISILLIFTTGCQKEAKENKQLLIQYPSIISKQEPIKYTNTGFKVLGKEIFGIKLGERFEDVEKRYNLKKEDKDNDDEFGIYSYDFLSTSIKKSTVTFGKNQVSSIKVYFSDSSLSNFNGLLKRLENKYDTNIISSPSYNSYIDGKICSIRSDICFVIIEGEGVFIRLELKDESLNEAEFSIEYEYDKIYRMLRKWDEEKRSSGVAEDL